MKIEIKKGEKILLVLLDLSEGSRKNMKFEDIVVALFKKFPDSFHLKGYKEYPDSGDSIKRRLYTFRDDGLLLVNNMIFSLTDKGIDTVKKIQHSIHGKKPIEKENFDRYIQKEINRIQNLQSFKMFINDEINKILDTDFFDYLGLSVRSERMNFKARLNLLNEVSKILHSRKEKLFQLIVNFHEFMMERFKEEIKFKLNN